MKKITFIKDLITIATISICGIGIIVIFFATMERYQVLVAGTDSDSVIVSLSVFGVISISSPANVSMSPGITGTGSSTGSATWTVETNNTNGWKLEVKADASPALDDGSGNSFADYTESVAGVPEAWSVSASDSEFGFTASGTHAESKYSNGTLYEGFEGTTDIKIAEDSSVTSGGGEDITVGFKAEVGSSKTQPQGTYEAVITATATTL